MHWLSLVLARVVLLHSIFHLLVSIDSAYSDYSYNTSTSSNSTSVTMMNSTIPMFMISSSNYTNSTNITNANSSELFTAKISTPPPAAILSTPGNPSLSSSRSGLQPYTGKAIDFIKEFGDGFSVFDSFLNRSRLGNAASRAKFESMYRIHNHSHYYFNGASSAPGIYTNWSNYAANLSASSLEYNNRFRHGPAPGDRFLDVFIRGDPWDDGSNKTLFVHFAGLLVHVPAEDDTYCHFKFPKVAISKLTVTLFPDENIIGATPRKSNEKMYSCEIPFLIPDHLKVSSLNPLNPIVVVLDFVISNVTAIADIQIPRIHKLDRRYFNYTVCTMIEYVNDRRLRQWLTYNIMLGIEHFYFFDNGKVPHSYSHIENSEIKPFLDANLITLINYQYSYPKGEFWAQNQRASFQVFLQKYGMYSQWVGLYDIDEYFVPSRNNWPKAESDILSLIPVTIKDLWRQNGLDQVPCIMFDSQEMGCSLNPLISFKGAAYASYCTVRGFKFSEYQSGHGKMFIRPSMVPILTTPHRLQNYFAIWTNPNNGGLFYHYDGFRYQPGGPFGADDTLSQLTKILVNHTMTHSLLVRSANEVNSPGNGEPFLNEHEDYAHVTAHRRRRR